jgi:hypothetical protein
MISGSVIRHSDLPFPERVSLAGNQLGVFQYGKARRERKLEGSASAQPA